MRVQSIRTAVEPRNPTRNRFLGASIEMAFREMHTIAEGHDIPEKVGPVAEALQNTGHRLPSRLRAPFVVDRRHLTGGVRILNQVDLQFWITHVFWFAVLIKEEVSTLPAAAEPR